MSLIFIGYMLYSSKQQAEYQQYLEQVQAEEAATAQANEDIEAEQAQAAVSDEHDAESALEREKNIYGDYLVAARNAQAQEFTMSNDYLTVDFSTLGGVMSKVTLEEYTKFAPKGERNEKVVLYDPSTAKFDMTFYIKQGLNNLPINTSEYVFTSEGVRREGDAQRLVMQLEVAAGAFLQYEYVLYDEKNPSRDYMLDFNIKLVNLSPIMAQQSTLGIEWANRTYQNERSFKTENMYTTLSYHLPGEESVEDLGMSEDAKSKQVQSEVNWVAFRQQFFSQAFIAHNNFAYSDMGFTTDVKDSGFIKNYSAQVLKANMRIVGATEFAVVLYRDKLPKFNNGRQYDENGKVIRGTGKMVFDWIQWERDGKEYPKIHPTQKPIGVLKKLIEVFTDEGDIVIDPVAGSASTLQAAYELNRNAYGFEVNTKFYKEAKEKMPCLKV